VLPLELDAPNALSRFFTSDLLTSTTMIEGDSSSLQLADLGEATPERSLYTYAAVRLERF